MAKRRTRFERRLIRARNRIEIKGQKLAFNAIKKQYKAVFDIIDLFPPNSLMGAIEQFVSETPVKEFMVQYYQMFSELALMTRNEALSSKDEDEFFENRFMDRLRHFALVETGANVTGITVTTEKYIRGAIESAITQATEEGLGAQQTSKLIRTYLQDSLGDIGASRAKTIARTEMTIGSNTASQVGIESTGLPYKKFWSNSGLPNIRDSHIFAQDNYPDGIGQNELFDMGNGNFMRHVGDPQGPPEEVINCRCTTLYEVL